MAGYIEKRGKNSWRLVVPAGTDSKGKRIRRSKTVKGVSKSEAKKELAKFVTEIESGAYIAPEKMKFAIFVEEWKEKHAKKHLAPTSLTTYLQLINQRIIPAFGHLQLDQVKPIHIVNFLDNLSEDGIRDDGKEGAISSSYIQKYYTVLRNIFSRAVEWKLIKENPVAQVKQPKVTYKEREIYDEESVSKLYKALETVELKWRVIVMLAVTCGLRRGEILGLEWKHIDLDNQTLEVKQTLTYTKSSGYMVKEPKTKNAKRKVSLPSFVVPLLKKLKSQKNEERIKVDDLWQGGEHFFLFSSWDGKPLNPSSVKTWWHRFLERNNMPKITFHDLRHTSATLLINRGAHAKTISARLGHADIKTTMNIYGHALESADKAAADHFDQMFNQKKTTL